MTFQPGRKRRPGRAPRDVDGFSGSWDAQANEHKVKPEQFDQHVRERIQSEGGEAEAAERRLLETFNELLEASGTLVRHHFEQTLLRAAREHIEQRG